MPDNMTENRTEHTPLLRAVDVKKYYPAKGSFGPGRAPAVRAVDGVTFDLYKGETLGLVGESGCGKSTLGRQLVGLEKPDSGSIWYKDRDMACLSRRELKTIRTQLQMVFQDSYSSLNPRKRVFDILSEPMLYHGLADKHSVQGEVKRLLDMVGLPVHVQDRYPHEFSGGQRQRIGIARALCLKPELLVCDEPVSALDVSIQAQILNLFRSLQEQLHLTCVFIGHGLGAVNYVSHRIAVMYLGKIVELADSAQLFADPVHPYSKALFQAVPVPDPRIPMAAGEGLLEGEARELEEEGEIPGTPLTGCPFYPRCPRRQDSCRREEQPLLPIAPGSSHLAACGPALKEVEGRI